MGTFRARSAPRRRCRGIVDTSGWPRSFSAIWTRSTVWTRSPRNSRAWTTRFAQQLVQRRGRVDGASLRRCAWPPRACRADGRTARDDRAPLADDRSGLWRGARCGARGAPPNRRSERRLEDLVPLGAVLADLERFDEADAVYRQAFYSYDGVSPFPLAWVCFQLGMLWGELVPVPDPNRAALWYRRAIAYLPGYVKARVHLAEIYASQDQTGDAEALLLPALSSRDPEVQWRLADVLTAQGVRRGRGTARRRAVWIRGASRNTLSLSRTMRRSSTPAAATTAGERSNWRAERRESSDAPAIKQAQAIAADISEEQR